MWWEVGRRVVLSLVGRGAVGVGVGFNDVHRGRAVDSCGLVRNKARP